MPLSQTIESLRLIGKSDAMQQLYKMIGRASNADCAILLIGERGSGKTTVARALHYFSHRPPAPFNRINGLLARETNDEEILGIDESHPPEATCYITDFTAMPSFVQHQLVTIHKRNEYKCSHKNQMRKHDFRFVVANNGNIKQELETGAMPLDLYYDWNFLPIYVPALRERKEDIPLLANYFLETLAIEMNISRKDFSPEAKDVLMSHDWPGNLAELKSTVQTALLNCRGNYIRAEHLPGFAKVNTENLEAFSMLEMFLSSKLSSYIENSPASYKGNLYRLLVPQIEKSLFQYALKKSKGNRNEAARFLGLHRNTLNKKLQTPE
jgi:two-component system nitrogen regulation response regulator GlnG